MKAVPKVPNYSVMQHQSMLFEYRVENSIQWEYFTIVDVITYLPAK